jgi:hypothetical protein
MTEDEVRRSAEGLAQAMGITFYVVRTSERDFLEARNATPKSTDASITGHRIDSVEQQNVSMKWE